MSTRTASLEEFISSGFSYLMADVYTSMPAVIVAVRNNLQDLRVDVQPAINIKSREDDSTYERPTIANVPLQMPIGLEGGLTFPVSKGTPVMLSFSMRGLEVWKRGNGKPDAPVDFSRFSAKDAIAVPSIFPNGMSPNRQENRSLPHSTEDVVLTHNMGSGNEVEIRLTKSGNVVINAPKNKVIVNTEDAEVNSKNFKVDSENVLFKCVTYTVNTAGYSLNATDYAESFGSISHQGSFKLNGITVEDHDHGGVQSGGSKTNVFGS